MYETCALVEQSLINDDKKRQQRHNIDKLTRCTMISLHWTGSLHRNASLKGIWFKGHHTHTHTYRKSKAVVTLYSAHSACIDRAV